MVARRPVLLGVFAALFLALVVLGDLTIGDRPWRAGPETVAPEPVVRALSFTDLSGWTLDDQAEAIGPFLRSCDALLARAADRPVNPLETLWDGAPALSGTTADWLPACAAAAKVDPDDTQAARAFFEAEFVPVFVGVPDDPALLTGYFEPVYEARRSPTEDFTAPALTPPDDMIRIDLGLFDPELKGRSLRGELQGDRLVPYRTHAQIAAAVPPGSDTLGYLDPNDLLFLQIQGSGQLAFEDGTTARVGYADKNGRAYVPVGRTLIEDGELTLETVSMQSIREWLAEAPAEAAARVRHSNPSYVFFRPLDLADPDLGPLGAQGVQLTPMRSLAVDPKTYAYGAPVFVEATGVERPDGSVPPFTRLFVAQDTGGAIRGRQRADVYFGTGDAAGDMAGVMRAEGRMVVLVPRRLWERASDEPSS